MCTVVLALQPGSPWPVLIAANRDESRNRPWLAPARHWLDQTELIAGYDQLAGGSWMGINNDGLFAAILNGIHTLGPSANKRSRGELILEALNHADAAAAASALADLDGSAWRPFYLIVADADSAWMVSHYGTTIPQCFALNPGISMVTARGLNNSQSPRVRHFLPAFTASQPNLPPTAQAPLDLASWGRWPELLGSREYELGADWSGAMNIESGGLFGTICSSLIALPDRRCFTEQTIPSKPIWFFAEGPPDKHPFRLLDLN